jgi:hypothetical protein
MLNSSKTLISQFVYWVIRATCIWAMVYLPSAHANCTWSGSTSGFQTVNWITPTLPAGSTRQEIARITFTANMTKCQSSGGDYVFGPVMSQFSNASIRSFSNISSTFKNGVFNGTYYNKNIPTFIIEATASFSNLLGSNCKPTITATTISGNTADTPGIKFTNNPASLCNGFRYTGTIVVVQTADVVWGDKYSKDCRNPDACLLIFWVNTQLWTAVIMPGSRPPFLSYIYGLRLEVWGKFPPIPPPPPTKKCVVQLQSAPTRSRL